MLENTKIKKIVIYNILYCYTSVPVACIAKLVCGKGQGTTTPPVLKYRREQECIVD